MIQLALQKLLKSSYSLVLGAIALFFIGIITLKSIASSQTVLIQSNSYFKQLIFLIPALIGFLVAFCIPRGKIHRFISGLYFIMLFIIILPFFGSKIANTYRWIDLGLPVGFQPSELAKWIVVLALARYLSNSTLQMKNIKTTIVPILIALIPALIILNQPDLGTAIILLVPVIPMLYWVGARPFHLFLIIAPLISILAAFHWTSLSIWAMVMMFILFFSKPSLTMGISTFFGNIFLGLLSPVLWGMLKGYQQKRILTMFNPDLDPLGSAYQIIQSKTAIGAGGLTGKGWGLGTQTQLKFLPVQESDFIVSVIGEEFGFLGIFVLITLFSLFIFKVLHISYNVNDMFSSLAIFGFGTMFIAHIFVNGAMTVGLIPVKGLPLPFISYGGSYLLSCFIMVGLIMNMGIDPEDF